MLNLKIDYQCPLCKDTKKAFYIMPLDEKTKSNDYISSIDKFVVQCKKCRQKYLLKIGIEVK